MRVKKLERPGDFLAEAQELLLADEARNNLILGIAGNVRDHPTLYPEFHLWLVEDAGRTVGAALQTPPYNLVLAGPTSPEAIDALAAGLRADRLDLPGVTGALPEVDAFAESWASRVRIASRRRMTQRIYRLANLRPVTGVRGRARDATEEDRSLLVAWVRAFVAEVAPRDSPDRGAVRTVDARLREGAGGFTVWEHDGLPVSVAGWGGLTPNGVRIGPVYTPPEHRGRGYASAVTATVSAERLASGRSFCFLYTDAANPTSNKIYTKLGYEPVCESVDFAFDAA